MKILNLVDLEKSEIKYEISRFPDGQQQVKILGETSVSYKPVISHGTFLKGVQIKARLNNFKDLELIICATKSLRELGVKQIHLYTPFFLGSRSDRKFEEGSNNYLKDIICPIINSLNFESITVLDPHSNVLEACLNNFKKVDNLKLVDFFIKDYTKLSRFSDYFNKEDLNKFIIISPDAGANKKIFKIAEQISYKGDIITCTKSRDENGKLSHIKVPYDESLGTTNKDLIIIDDICDGGATFINIVKAIQESEMFYGKIYLIVTHGIFSKGFNELSKYFDGVYCTNSYQSIIVDLDKDKWISNNVKQLNVF